MGSRPRCASATCWAQTDVPRGWAQPAATRAPGCRRPAPPHHDFRAEGAADGVPQHEDELGIRVEGRHAGGGVVQARVHGAGVKAEPLPRVRQGDGRASIHVCAFCEVAHGAPCVLSVSDYGSSSEQPGRHSGPARGPSFAHRQADAHLSGTAHALHPPAAQHCGEVRAVRQLAGSCASAQRALEVVRLLLQRLLGSGNGCKPGEETEGRAPGWQAWRAPASNVASRLRCHA